MRLGPYEISAQIGVGGMGEVYRATDTNLARQVAIKVLPESMATDAERLARFDREAKTLAALNHPNIAAIYGLERSDGQTALVMELVEGPSLADRIAEGSIPVDEALAIATQIAEALEAAHEQGIIHRDLKPANIKVRHDGTVKVLDFGLAKLTAPNTPNAANALSLSPTITSPAMMTGVGVLLGTAAYMSPEQAKGRPADKRSDIWAFGCVLFEMLTGKRAFDGEDVSETLAAVIKGEPDWNRLPANTPAPVRRLLRRCLEKDRRRRLDSAVALRLEIEESQLPDARAASPAVSAVQSSSWRRVLVAVAGALLVAAVTSAVWWLFTPRGAVNGVTRFTVPLAEGQEFAPTGRGIVAISPDGGAVAYAANKRLYVWSMATGTASPVAGSESATEFVNNPTFSPDGQWIAFWDVGTRLIKKVHVKGGTAVEIAESGNPTGMSWNGDDILIGQPGSILRVSSNGGTPEVVVRFGQDEGAATPQMLPDGQTVLFTLVKSDPGGGLDFSQAQVVAQSLGTSERTTLVEKGASGHYVSTGHLVYAVGGVLFAVRMDAQRLRLEGGAVPVVEGVRRGPNVQLAAFSVAGNGSLVYVSGPSATSTTFEIAFVDRQGAVERLKMPPGPYEYPRISPDGKRLAFGTDDGTANVWVYELTGTNAPRQLTLEGRNRFPLWSADSNRVAFQSDRQGDPAIYWQPVDGGTAERLTTSDPRTVHVPESWSPDGEHLLFDVIQDTNHSLWILSLKDKKASPLADIRSRFPINSTFSPSGRLIAYTSGDAGPISLFVRPFPITGDRWRVASGNGPIWSSDGKELFFNTNPGRGLDTVSVTMQAGFAVGSPRLQGVAGLRLRGPGSVREVTMAPDGTRFVGVVPTEQPAEAGGPRQIHIVLNWYGELKRLVPTK